MRSREGYYSNKIMTSTNVLFESVEVSCKSTTHPYDVMDIDLPHYLEIINLPIFAMTPKA